MERLYGQPSSRISDEANPFTYSDGYTDYSDQASLMLDHGSPEQGRRRSTRNTPSRFNKNSFLYGTLIFAGVLFFLVVPLAGMALKKKYSSFCSAKLEDIAKRLPDEGKKPKNVKTDDYVSHDKTKLWTQFDISVFTQPKDYLGEINKAVKKVRDDNTKSDEEKQKILQKMQEGANILCDNGLRLLYNKYRKLYFPPPSPAFMLPTTIAKVLTMSPEVEELIGTPSINCLMLNAVKAPKEEINAAGIDEFTDAMERIPKVALWLALKLDSCDLQSSGPWIQQVSAEMTNLFNKEPFAHDLVKMVATLYQNAADLYIAQKKSPFGIGLIWPYIKKYQAEKNAKLAAEKAAEVVAGYMDSNSEWKCEDGSTREKSILEAVKTMLLSDALPVVTNAINLVLLDVGVDEDTRMKRALALKAISQKMFVIKDFQDQQENHTNKPVFLPKDYKLSL